MICIHCNFAWKSKRGNELCPKCGKKPRVKYAMCSRDPKTWESTSPDKCPDCGFCLTLNVKLENWECFGCGLKGDLTFE